ncbi:lipopolysaccharide biosynthesis protein [Acetobacterium bakii]|uniref:Sugar translocase n=1 Tax=Acetobacterium bakii TaxID=52689 RepID=A0A0L6U416_9FIRM|nr:hypothetical protein [Acetobacterium bakii]KNZ42530.1 hypothetical protein AKG39_06325 [Acetobacterium bakii]
MRKRNSILNIMTGISSQIILILLGFFVRKIFVDIMGFELLGINGLFNSIIAMLSLAELGIGGAIYFSLYKPLADNNHEQISAIMQLYSKLYKYIALFVGIIGISLLPFIKIIAKVDVDQFYLNIIFLIFLTDAVLSYLLAYIKNIISADQKNYVINTVQTCFSIIILVLQGIIIITTHNFIIYLTVKLIMGIMSNLLFYYIARKRYPYLKEKNKIVLAPEIKSEIIKNAKALFLVQMAVYFVSGTDNVLIAIFLGVSMVGIYSNYLLIITTVTMLNAQVFSGITASFGNFLVNKSMKDAHRTYKIIFFFNFWLIAFCSTALIVLLNPFILMWLGNEAVLNQSIVIIIVTNFLCRGMNSSIGMVRNSAGLYSPYPFFKWWSIIEGILNLVLCILFLTVFDMGLFGILFAATLSTQLNTLVLPWNTYKYVFKMNKSIYFRRYFYYIVFAIVIMTTTSFIADSISFSNMYINFSFKALMCLIIPNALIILAFKQTEEFKYIWEIIQKAMVNKFKRLENLS